MKSKNLRNVITSLVFLVLPMLVRAQVSFFEPATYQGSGTLFVADFNRDGKPDLLSADGTLQLGKGDGTFTAGTAAASGVSAVADFTGDGKADILELGLGTLLVQLGNGDGTFQPAISTASGANLKPIAAVDLNGDGKADLIGVFNNTLLVYLSNGDGTFAPGVPYNLGAVSAGQTLLSVGDFNGDGKVDVVVSIAGNNVPGQEIVLLGNGDGTFQGAKTSNGIYYPSYAVAGDFDGDGKLDLATSGSGSTSSVYILLGNGDGTFQAPTAAFPGSGPLAAADLNGDGKLDLVLQGDPTVAQIYLGNGNGTFTLSRNYVLSLPIQGTKLSGIAIADFDLDGKPDIAVGNAVLLGHGDGSYQGIQLGVVPNHVEPDLVTGDFDKNGTTDVAVLSNQQIGNTYFYSVYVLKNDGGGGLSLIHTYSLQQPGYGIVTADLNRDGNLDLVVVGIDPVLQQWSYSVLLGNGDGSFQSPVFYPQSFMAGAVHSNMVAVADFNNDHKPDIATSIPSNQSLALLLGNGDGTFAVPAYLFDGGQAYLSIADFNGDGKLDIAAGSVVQLGPTTAILFGNGDGTFQNAVFPTSLNNFAARLSTDFNGDGKPDLMSFNQVALGNGDGTFTTLPALTEPEVLAVGDLNGDVKPDAIVVLPSGFLFTQTGVRLGNGDGTFGAFINVPKAGQIPSGFVLADMNGDGRPDIVFPQASAVNGVGVLLNTTSPVPPVAPDFMMSMTSPGSQTISAGQSVSFTLVVTPSGSFNGTVNLTCGIAPAVNTTPTCNLSTSSLHLTGNGAQTVTVTVGTSARGAVGSVSPVDPPPAAMPFAWALLLMASAWLLRRNRKRLLALVAPIMLLALAAVVGCGGGSSSSGTLSATGTPPGTYTATVTAASGNMSHSMVLQVVVH